MSPVLVISLLVLLTPAVAAARETPKLELPADGWHVVDPYRYDEARRFERGWNRGADAIASGGVVRSVTAGTVRFAGTIAGRRIVTVSARLEGMDVVVTYTGLESIGVREGDSIDANARLGRGIRVHVGAYDAARRSRYLPVTIGTGAAPRGEDGLSGVIASRLRKAIDGTATGATAATASINADQPDGLLGPRSAPTGPSASNVTSIGSFDVGILDRALRARTPTLPSTVARAGVVAAASLARAADARTAPSRSAGARTSGSNNVVDAARRSYAAATPLAAAVGANRTVKPPVTESLTAIPRDAASRASPAGRLADHEPAASGRGAIKRGTEARQVDALTIGGQRTAAAGTANIWQATGAVPVTKPPSKDAGVSGPRQSRGGPSGERSAAKVGANPSAGAVSADQVEDTAHASAGAQRRPRWRPIGSTVGSLGALLVLVLLALRRRMVLARGGDGVVVHRIPPPVVPSPRRHGRVILPMPPEERCESHVSIAGEVGLPDIEQPHEHPVRRRPREPA